MTNLRVLWLDIFFKHFFPDFFNFHFLFQYTYISLFANLLDETSAHNFCIYLLNRHTRIDKSDFLMEMMLLFSDICTQKVRAQGPGDH